MDQPCSGCTDGQRCGIPSQPHSRCGLSSHKHALPSCVSLFRSNCCLLPCKYRAEFLLGPFPLQLHRYRSLDHPRSGSQPGLPAQDCNGKEPLIPPTHAALSSWSVSALCVPPPGVGTPHQPGASCDSGTDPPSCPSWGPCHMAPVLSPAGWGETRGSCGVLWAVAPAGCPAAGDNTLFPPCSASSRCAVPSQAWAG